MEEKEAYSFQELLEDLPISLAELARQSGVNEVTLARIRDGYIARRDTVNKLLLALGKVYNRHFTLRNVTGINVQVNKRMDRKAEQTREEAIA